MIIIKSKHSLKLDFTHKLQESVNNNLYFKINMERTVYNTRQDKQNTKRDWELVNLNLTRNY